MTSKKLSQFPNLVQVGSPTSPGFAGMITAFAGSAIPNGWALCNGSPLDKTTYAQLFARIGATWDVGTNPLTGVAYSAPGGNLFRLPDLRGTFLRGVGDFTDNSKDAILGGFQTDKTKPNGLLNAASSVTGSTNSSAVTGLCYPPGSAGTGWFAPNISGEANSSPAAKAFGSISGTAAGQTIASATAAAQSISGDSETRPQNVGVNYLIKLYDDAGAIVMSGSPFVGSNFSEDYATQIDNFTAEINKAYTVNKATAVAVTLPAATIGAVINFKNIGVGIATITKAGSDTIDGATSIALSQYQAIKLKCFAANLWGVY